MILDWNIRITDIAIFLATFLGPIFAVYAAELRREWTDARNRKVHIFRTLMATRAAVLNPSHIESLNLLEVEFNHSNEKERPVIDAWRMYLAHLNDVNYPRETWPARRVDLLLDLLYAMSVCLGYSYDKAQIKTGAYYPSGYGETEAELHEIRKSLLEIFRGKKKLPITAEIEGEQQEPKKS